MPDPIVIITVPTRGAGLTYTPVTAAMELDYDPTAILNIRNRSTSVDLNMTLTVTDADLGDRSVVIPIPAKAQRWFAPIARMVDVNTGKIELVFDGDLTTADLIYFNRNIPT